MKNKKIVVVLLFLGIVGLFVFGKQYLFATVPLNGITKLGNFDAGTDKSFDIKISLDKSSLDINNGELFWQLYGPEAGAVEYNEPMIEEIIDSSFTIHKDESKKYTEVYNIKELDQGIYHVLVSTRDNNGVLIPLRLSGQDIRYDKGIAWEIVIGEKEELECITNFDCDDGNVCTIDICNGGNNCDYELLNGDQEGCARSIIGDDGNYAGYYTCRTGDCMFIEEIKEECQSDEDCTDNEYCDVSTKVCKSIEVCLTNTDCELNEVCENGECVKQTVSTTEYIPYVVGGVVLLLILVRLFK